MSSSRIIVEILVNQYTFALTLINTSNLTYSLISPRLIKRTSLQYIPISPYLLEGVTKESRTIQEVATLTINIKGYKDTIQGYVSLSHLGYNLILRRLQINKRQVTITPSKKSIYIYLSSQRIRLISTKDRLILRNLNIRQISATAYYSYLQ